MKQQIRFLLLILMLLSLMLLGACSKDQPSEAQIKHDALPNFKGDEASITRRVLEVQSGPNGDAVAARVAIRIASPTDLFARQRLDAACQGDHLASASCADAILAEEISRVEWMCSDIFYKRDGKHWTRHRQQWLSPKECASTMGVPESEVESRFDPRILLNDHAWMMAKEYESAYAKWMDDNDGSCPKKIEDLLKYMVERDLNDPWGDAYVMKCGDNAPAEAPNGFGIISLGNDGQEGTEDDVHSWDSKSKK